MIRGKVREYGGEGEDQFGATAEKVAATGGVRQRSRPRAVRTMTRYVLPIAPVFGGTCKGLSKWAERSAIRRPAIQRNSHLKVLSPVRVLLSNCPRSSVAIEKTRGARGVQKWEGELVGWGTQRTH